MRLLALVAFVCIVCLSLARPQWKENDYDYRLYDDDASGVVIDRAHQKHHNHHHHSHHHHQKDYLKTNRVDTTAKGVRSFFDSFRL